MSYSNSVFSIISVQTGIKNKPEHLTCDGDQVGGSDASCQVVLHPPDTKQNTD